MVEVQKNVSPALAVQALREQRRIKLQLETLLEEVSSGRGEILEELENVKKRISDICEVIGGEE